MNIEKQLNNKNNFNDFVRVFADNYGDLNALHPFREGNGRTQREFARLICLQCGYDFNLSVTTHSQMLEASKLSFDKADSSGFIKIFSKAINRLDEIVTKDSNVLNILTSDDLVIGNSSNYDYYGYNEHENADIYNSIYQAKISEMDAKKIMSDAKESLRINNKSIESQSMELKCQQQETYWDLF